MSDNARMLEQAHKMSEAITMVAQTVVNYRNTLAAGGIGSAAADAMAMAMNEALMEQFKSSMPAARKR